jgi:hypothetical protein
VRLRGDNDITVLREQLTTEEQEANKRMFMVEGVREHLFKLLGNNPLDELQDAIEKYNPAYGELLSSYNLPGVLKTQARYRVGLHIRSYASKAAERRNVEIQLRLDNLRDDVKALDEDVLLDAFAMWYYENTDRRYKVGPQDPTSRSTSVLSNLIEDIEKWAVEKTIDDLRWYVIQGELDARVAAITEENKRNASK